MMLMSIVCLGDGSVEWMDGNDEIKPTIEQYQR